MPNTSNSHLNDNHTPEKIPVKYDHPNDLQLKFLQEPVLSGKDGGGVRGPSMNLILAAAAYDWELTRRGSLEYLVMSAGGTVDRFLKPALELGLIEDVGQLAKQHPVSINEHFLFGRKWVGDGTQKQKTRTPLERPDRWGLPPGARFVTTQGDLLRPHDLFKTEAVAALVHAFGRNGIVVVAHPEARLRDSFGLFSPRKPSVNPLYCTEVPDALMMLEGLAVRVEVQRTDKSELYYEMKCAACYGDPVVYVAIEDAVYNTLLKVKEKAKNLFVVRLGIEADVLALIVDLRQYALQPAFSTHRIADHYARPGFAYAAISPTHVPTFLSQTSKGQEDRRLFHATQVPEQHEEIERELKEKAREAWLYFYPDAAAKRAAAERAREKAISDAIYKEMEEDMKRQIEKDKRPWNEGQ